jgi:signal transduction histidine kinase
VTILGDVVIAITSSQQICVFNAAAEAAFNLKIDDVLGHDLAEFPALVALFESDGGKITLPNGDPYRHQLLQGGGKVLILNSIAGENRLANLMGEVVHTLKTPISSGKHFIEFIGQFGPMNERQMEYATRAQHSLDYMLDIVHELLDIAWLESGRDPKSVTVNLCDLMRRATSQFESQALRQQTKIQMELPESCFVSGDERRLESAVGNLISNAIKYSPNGGQIVISLKTNGDKATFHVKDQGLGVPQEHLAHIFERFYRVRTNETRRIEGSGLGLAIVKAVIERHGGQVFVESTQGQGSTFGFTLPTVDESISTD